MTRWGVEPGDNVAAYDALKAWMDAMPSGIEDSRQMPNSAFRTKNTRTLPTSRRRKADQADRTDSFILHKFEAILSMIEFLNLNRRVEDDDEGTARKAADDQDVIGLAQVSKAPATRLKLHLDLAPEDVDREQISGTLTYPEWDVRIASYLPTHARVLVPAPLRPRAFALIPHPEKLTQALPQIYRRLVIG